MAAAGFPFFSARTTVFSPFTGPIDYDVMFHSIAARFVFFPPLARFLPPLALSSKE